MNEVVQRYLVGTGKGTGNSTVVFFGFARCPNPRRYIRQLLKDWPHQMETHLFDGRDGVPVGVGLIYLSGAKDALLTPKDGGIQIGVRTTDRQHSEHWRGEIELQLDSLAFRFRDTPLKYEWTEK